MDNKKNNNEFDLLSLQREEKVEIIYKEKSVIDLIKLKYAVMLTTLFLFLLLVILAVIIIANNYFSINILSLVFLIASLFVLALELPVIFLFNYLISKREEDVKLITKTKEENKL